MFEIAFNGIVIGEDAIAFAVFILCYASVYLITEVSRGKRTGDRVRELYRASFIESLLMEKGNMAPLQSILSNNIAITSATLTGVIIMAGLLFDQIVEISSSIGLLRSAAMLILLGHVLLSLLAQIRMMMYMPVIFGADPKVIKDTQGIAKHEYLTRLFSTSYRLFSNAMKDVFFLFALFIWSVNTYVFMLMAVVITVFILREEMEKKARITVF